MARNERAGLGVLFFGSILLWKQVFGWYGWESFYAVLLSVATTFVLGLAGEAIRDTWPRGVPWELKPLVETYEAVGWKRTRIHPWWQCHGQDVANAPHVHMMGRDHQVLIVGGKTLDAPRTRLPEGL